MKIIYKVIFPNDKVYIGQTKSIGGIYDNSICNAC